MERAIVPAYGIPTQSQANPTLTLEANPHRRRQEERISEDLEIRPLEIGELERYELESRPLGKTNRDPISQSLVRPSTRPYARPSSTLTRDPTQP